MSSKDKKPLNVALYGMDERSHKTMVMYLQGPCKGVGIVVDELDAEIDIIDADCINARELMEDRQAKTPDRPLILLPLEEMNLSGTIYVKKLVPTVEMVDALNRAKGMLNEDIPQEAEVIPEQDAIPEPEPKIEKIQPVVESKQAETKQVETKQAGTKKIDSEERKKTSKHRTAMDLTEKGFHAYIGHVEGVDFSDREQVLKASYRPKDFFLGYVYSAIKVAREKNRILRLNSSWKPLMIFPHGNEIWLDADDKQLRAFAGLEIKNESGKGMSLTPVDKNVSESINEKMENFHDADAFVWRLAIWTSKGRYPEVLDINKPVYLKHWPNFTRLVVTPHAIQIAALLINGPRTLINIADALKIKPQYVFVFISAAHTLGLVGQARRKADQMIAPAEVKKSRSQGLLSKILGRLRSQEKLNNNESV